MGWTPRSLQCRSLLINNNGDIPWIGFWIVTCILEFPPDFRWNSITNVSCTVIANNSVKQQHFPPLALKTSHYPRIRRAYFPAMIQRTRKEYSPTVSTDKKIHHEEIEHILGGLPSEKRGLKKNTKSGFAWFCSWEKNPCHLLTSSSLH